MKFVQDHHINIETWSKLIKLLIIIAVWFPFSASVFTFSTWPIIGNNSWIKPISFTWVLIYIILLILFKKSISKSKYTFFLLFVCILSFDIHFIVISSACAYRFYGFPGVLIQNSLLLSAGIPISIYYFRYWNKVWESHRKHNETVVLDLENGRYDFLNNFDMSEDKVTKNQKKKLSGPSLANIVITSASIGSAIPVIFSKSGDYTIPIIIAWVLSIPFILGWLKVVVAIFYNYRKLAYYEKKIGKPIINGLLR